MVRTRPIGVDGVGGRQVVVSPRFLSREATQATASCRCLGGRRGGLPTPRLQRRFTHGARSRRFFFAGRSLHGESAACARRA